MYNSTFKHFAYSIHLPLTTIQPPEILSWVYDLHYASKGTEAHD